MEIFFVLAMAFAGGFVALGMTLGKVFTFATKQLRLSLLEYILRQEVAWHLQQSTPQNNRRIVVPKSTQGVCFFVVNSQITGTKSVDTDVCVN